MLIESYIINEYPFSGVFYRTEIDNDAPLDEREEKEIVILETECDIQENHHTDDGGFISATFKIFFPFNPDEGIEIKRGDTFRGNLYGVHVEGEVVGVFPTMLEGCEVYIRDFDS